MKQALTRAVSRSIGGCQLTHLPRTEIDVERARRQHAGYEAALERLGYRVLRLPEEPELPDAVFVEDVALVLDELAIVTRPGAEARRPEAASVARALAEWLPVQTMAGPGTIDGGDLLRIDRTIYAGRSSRSDEAGLEELARHLAPAGYRVVPVEVRGCLHLKSAVTRVGPRELLVQPEWVDPALFEGMRAIEVAPDEPQAANALWSGEAAIHPAAHVATRARLEERGISVLPVEISEIALAEGAVTCCSLLVQL